MPARAHFFLADIVRQARDPRGLIPAPSEPPSMWAIVDVALPLVGRRACRPCSPYVYPAFPLAALFIHAVHADGSSVRARESAATTLTNCPDDGWDGSPSQTMLEGAVD